VAVAAVLLLLVVGWLVTRDGDPAPTAGSGSRATGPSTTTATGTPTSATTATRSPAATSSSPTAVRQRGTGRLVVVPGRAAAPGRGRVTTVRVEVEQGVEVEPRPFADAVLATLNDPRSWGHGGTRTFARTTGSADVVVVLASPDTSAGLCRPLVTHGKLSCGQGSRAVLTSYRWLLGTPEFPDLAVYRQYVVNHEVGHVLGHHHETCPGPGRPAPVMQQQTYGLKGCVANSWPYVDGQRYTGPKVP
jgi:hypothetical protein